MRYVVRHSTIYCDRFRIFLSGNLLAIREEEMGNRLSFPAVDLSGRVAVVTGGNSGVGYETAKALATMGAHTIIACRSRERAEEAIERIKTEVNSENEGKQVMPEFMFLDLCSFASVKEFVVAFKKKNLPLHILVNNAGIAYVPQGKTENGYELHLQVNHLGHFLLTLELLPVLETTARETEDVRVVCVSSYVHKWGDWEPDNMNGERWYSRFRFYFKSKIYNVMAAYAFQRRVANTGITFSSLHPGTVYTNIIRGFDDMKLIKLLVSSYALVALSAKDGATTTINCAVNPDLNTQQCLYYDECKPTSSSATSRNEGYQEELWQKSIEMVKDFLSSPTLAKYGQPQPSTTLPSPHPDSTTHTEEGAD